MKTIQLKVSQKHLAKMVGVTESCVSYIFSGKRNPSIMTARKFAEAMEVSLGEFFDILDRIQSARRKDKTANLELPNEPQP